MGGGASALPLICGLVSLGGVGVSKTNVNLGKMGGLGSLGKLGNLGSLGRLARLTLPLRRRRLKRKK